MSSPDPRAVVRSLGVTGPVAVTPLAYRRGKGMWRIDTSGETFALRVRRPQEQNAIQREKAAIEAARRAGLEVPAVVAVGEWEDHPAMLLSWFGNPARGVE